jgi:methyltransferase-like protein/protein-L-isoaspartate O-methyltransferase
MGAQASYDQTPYPSLSYSQSHPDRLATVATLLGMSPTAVERCRVLELGCASGGNLIPMGYGLPGSQFVGVDISARQIAEGQTAVTTLGLRNVTLRHMDILEAGADLGKFDYIIAHGVYSWVPPAVQNKVLSICQQNLAANGVAYVSYNTYPGWHMINIVRDLMLYHTREVADPEQRATQARAVLDLIAGAGLPDDSAYGSFVKMYAQFLGGKLEDARPRQDALLLHDEMEEVNEPVYFHEFAERAAHHGLQHLGDAEFHTMAGSRGSMPPEAVQVVGKIARSFVEAEQYMDFAKNRTFRQTLLCHEDVTLNRTLKPDRVAGLYAASRARPAGPDAAESPGEAEPNVRSVSVVRFRGSDGTTLSIDHPASKAALLYLAEMWPKVVPFDALLAEARARVTTQSPEAKGRETEPPTAGADARLDAQVLGANLLMAYSYSDKLAELHAYVPPVASEAGDRPMASRVARFQASHDNDRVTNLRHERVSLDEADRHLLRYLDGSHDRGELVDLLLAGPVAKGILVVREDGKPVKDSGRVRHLLAEGLDKKLGWLASASLLLGQHDPGIRPGSP